MNKLTEELLKEFDEIGFGNQARIVGVKRVELKDFLRSRIDTLLQKEREAGKREGISEAIKDLPKELGFDDYDKHVHTYANEGSGKCGICGLSWRTTTIYGYYNTAIVQVKKLLRKKLKSQSVEKGKNK